MGHYGGRENVYNYRPGYITLSEIGCYAGLMQIWILTLKTVEISNPTVPCSSKNSVVQRQVPKGNVNIISLPALSTLVLDILTSVQIWCN